ncbi:MAG: prealbumin-like fold domain-containing protein, partial [bacterium]
SLVCSDPDNGTSTSARTATIDVDAGESVTCTYTNTKRGSVTVVKNTVGGDGTFAYTSTLDLTSLTTSSGTISQTFNDLQPGSFTVTETDPAPAFDFTSLVCSDPDNGTSTSARTATIDVDAGESVTCTYTNTKRGMVTVGKTVSGATPAAGAFDFEIRTGASPTEVGTTVASDSTDASGNVDFGGIKLVPGTYQFCEVNMLPGFATSLTGFVPNSDDPNADNSVICVPFTLDPGEIQNFVVDNTPPPGGDARTIGFWKNWTSCDGRGNQDPVLDQTLASFPLNLVTNTRGVLIGDIFVDTCPEGIAILDKSTLGGTKKANDAAYGLAAQLLAARLNFQAGAGTCPAANTAAANGQTLLDQVNFTATGDYLGPRVTGPALTQRNQALALAATLDQYNNNNLCP